MKINLIFCDLLLKNTQKMTIRGSWVRNQAEPETTVRLMLFLLGAQQRSNSMVKMEFVNPIEIDNFADYLKSDC